MNAIRRVTSVVMEMVGPHHARRSDEAAPPLPHPGHLRQVWRMSGLSGNDLASRCRGPRRALRVRRGPCRPGPRAEASEGNAGTALRTAPLGNASPPPAGAPLLAVLSGRPVLAPDVRSRAHP